ncbi:STAS domain [Macleaya cordata]|uniref:STAS domain n=1 Tax=Macleaya cordata TaxID=56857 RepID=A0A200QW18_MACCD|nr:STAS domain [Macleaya cordata]
MANAASSINIERRNNPMDDQLEINVENRTERARWVLNSPKPPGLWHELVGSIKNTMFPSRNTSSSSSIKNKPGSRSKRVFTILQGVFPILRWGQKYNLMKFKSDFLAGLTLASLSIPQSIGYANLAKLDPQYGLYTNVVPPMIYALMGSSREIAIGPVAVVSLLLSSMIQKIVDPSIDPAGYRQLVFTVTFFAGIFQAAFGIFRLGFLVNFLSHAAIVGFMGGAAIVIGLQQLKGLLGLTNFTNKTDVISVVGAVWRSIHHTWNPYNFLLGSSFLIFLLTTRFTCRKRKKLFWLPAIAPLVSVVLSTLIVFLTRGDKHGIKIVKHIKRGINPISIDQLGFNGSHVGDAVKIGLISAVVALAEAVAVGRSFASIKGYHLDGNKEMVAMGFMNIAGSITSCYLATGSFSRTAVNFSAGCETVISNIVMATTVIISLEFFTRLLYYTPIAILASIILSALPGLIDLNEAYNIWKIDKLDFLACVGAFFGVVFGSVEIGLLAALTISILKIILSSIRPGVEVLGRLPRTDIFGSINQYKMVLKTPGVLIIRIDTALLCFANANFVKERYILYIYVCVSLFEFAKSGTNGFIGVLMIGLLNIDTSGIIALEELKKKLVSLGIQVAIANPGWQVIHKLKLAKFVDKIGGELVFLTVGEAVDACLESKVASLNC